VVRLVVTGGSLTRRSKRSLRCLLVEVPWQINEYLYLKPINFAYNISCIHFADKIGGEKFSREFEESATQLEFFLKRYESYIEGRKSLLDLLDHGTVYYHAQYHEAKIVVNVSLCATCQYAVKMLWNESFERSWNVFLEVAIFKQKRLLIVIFCMENNVSTYKRIHCLYQGWVGELRVGVFWWIVCVCVFYPASSVGWEPSISK